MKLSEMQRQGLWEKIELAKRSPLRRGLRTALLAAAIVMTLCASALALSPTLRQALVQALGEYAPYSQSVEGAVTVQNGIEVKVISAMADSAMIRVYAEVRDVEGKHNLSDTSYAFAALRRTGMEDEHFGGSSFTTGVTGVSYDPETRTALMQIDTWGAFSGGLEDVELRIFKIFNERLSQRHITGEEWIVPLSIEKMEERVIPLTGAVWGIPLRQVTISPLGITVHTEGQQRVGSRQFAVQLADGSFLHPQFGGTGGDGLLNHPDPVQLTCFAFDDPALADQITGVAFGYWFIPIDGETAGAGYWLKELPE